MANLISKAVKTRLRRLFALAPACSMTIAAADALFISDVGFIDSLRIIRILVMLFANT